MAGTLLGKNKRTAYISAILTGGSGGIRTHVPEFSGQPDFESGSL